jgi:hypothetical protein
MELEASSVAVYDPGDPNLGKHQGSRSNDSGKQIPQELSLPEIMPFEASHESSGIPDSAEKLPCAGLLLNASKPESTLVKRRYAALLVLP